MESVLKLQNNFDHLLANGAALGLGTSWLATNAGAQSLAGGRIHSLSADIAIVQTLEERSQICAL
jgi:hypothetical protein